MCPNDPLVYNEIGVVYFKQGDWAHAEQYFEEVMRLVAHLPHPLLVSWEATRCNLGHVCRKMQKLEEAASHYETALGLCPRRASTYTALGFTRHMQGKFDRAIEHYHQALGIRPTDTFASEMLRRALEDALESADWMNDVPLN
jgi:anaphase-promoting complex subunit 6